LFWSTPTVPEFAHDGHNGADQDNGVQKQRNEAV
jgi:hypothetical protein